MLDEYFSQMSDIKWMLSSLAKSKGYVKYSVRREIYENIKEYSVEEVKAFRNLLFAMDKERQYESVNELKDVFMAGTLSRALDNLYVDKDEEIIVIRTPMGEFENEDARKAISSFINNLSTEEKDLLEKSVAAKTKSSSLLEKREEDKDVVDKAKENLVKCELLGAIISEAKYIEHNQMSK